jgi:NTE family protein
MTRVGLVLGAGGITGIAWLVGALEAVREHSGWDPRTADVIAGTSAGAVAAVVTAAGIPSEDLLAMAEQPERLERAIRRATGGRGRDAEPSRPPLLPGSIRLALGGLVAADPRHRVTSLQGFVPRGWRAGDEIRGLTHAAVRLGWPRHTQLLLHACDVRTGARVAFGHPDAPPADLADAVVASCAVPAYYRPVRIGGREYIDGGLASFSNADSLLGLDCDVVLCLSPFASRHRGSVLDSTLFGAVRRATAWRLDQEVRQLRRAGSDVAVIGPAGDDLRAMGLQVMDRSRSRLVMETARASVGARLDELLAGVALPGSSPAPARLLAA